MCCLNFFCDKDILGGEWITWPREVYNLDSIQGGQISYELMILFIFHLEYV